MPNGSLCIPASEHFSLHRELLNGVGQSMILQAEANESAALSKTRLHLAQALYIIYRVLEATTEPEHIVHKRPVLSIRAGGQAAQVFARCCCHMGWRR